MRDRQSTDEEPEAGFAVPLIGAGLPLAWSAAVMDGFVLLSAGAWLKSG